MEEDDGFDIDPAIAEALGFSGFGKQPGKKRKFNPDDGAFVDPDARQAAKPTGTPSKGNGANHTPLGSRPAAGAGFAILTGNGSGESADTTAKQATSAQPVQQQLPDTRSMTDTRSGPPSLQALRQGVPNERGDMAYFLPSFIEDPWKNLRSQ